MHYNVDVSTDLRLTCRHSMGRVGRAINVITALSTLVDCVTAGLMARSATIEGSSEAEMLDDVVFYLQLAILVGKTIAVSPGRSL